MRVFSWNVQGRAQTTLGRQFERVLARSPDLIALQEVTKQTLPDWERGLQRAGFTVLSTVALAGRAYPRPPYSTPPFPLPRAGRDHDHIKRKFFNLCAARHPMSELPGLEFDDPEEREFAFPEKYLAVQVVLDGAAVELHNAHLPPGVSRGVIKVHHFEAIRRRVERDDNLKVLCGDFNAPWSEDAKGPLVDRGRGWPKEVKERWFKAETALFNLSAMSDTYRRTHRGPWESPVSHRTGRAPRLTPHRYDYIFASNALTPTRCTYLSDWLDRDEEGWRASDHAPVEADFVLPG
jgi:endonuclease/exonuclease/phosphatase family metal-dependent hydrolase